MGSPGALKSMPAPAASSETVPSDRLDELSDAARESLRLAIEQHVLGCFSEAVRLYREVLALCPGQADAHHNLGAISLASGDAGSALAHFETARRGRPKEGQFWLSSIEGLIQTGQPRAARQLLKRGRSQGLRGAAVDSMQAKLSTLPAGKTGSRRKRADREAAEPTATMMEPLMACYLAGKYGEAETLARRLTERFPAHGFGWKALGVMLQEQGRTKEALAVKQQAALLQPEDAESHSNLGNALLKLSRYDEAEACYRRALSLRSGYPEAWSNLGITLQRLGRLAEGEAGCRRALELRPDYADALSNLGIVLQEQERLTEAEISYRAALAIHPGHADAANNLGVTLQKLGRMQEAEAAHRRAIELKPALADAYTNLAGCLQQQARPDEAETCYRRAIELDPEQLNAHTNLLFCLSHNPRTTADELFAEHLRFAEHFEAPLRAGWKAHANDRDPERVLRVGFVSADFREHAMSYFIEPTLTAMSRQPGLDLYVYANHVLEDARTLRLRERIPQWRAVFGLSDDALAGQIRADGIDILVDLSGHTGGNRLLALARRPAPVQCGWIGYLGTSGLRAIDYSLTDAYYLPYDRFAACFTERLAYLPAVSAFEPSSSAPPVSDLPALAAGHLTLGSFSRMGKFSRRVVVLWARLLHLLPAAQLVLGAMPRDGRSELLAGWFADEGIDSSRLRFLPGVAMPEYLELHRQIDFCLDPFPFTGATTTGHALWMGVPTLTLEGATPPGRLGAAILRHLDLGSFVAENEADFIEKGLFWAANLSLLAELRAGMRERFERSLLGQPETVAAGFAGLFRKMWRGWCGDLPPSEVTLDVILEEKTGRGPWRAPALPLAAQAQLLAFFEAGDDEATAALAQDLAIQWPDSGFVWNLLGAVRQRQSRPADAEAAYRQAESSAAAV